MKIYPILTFSLLLFVLFSCSSETTTQEPKTDAPTTENEMRTAVEEVPGGIVVERDTEGQAVRESSTENEPSDTPPNHEKEIWLIRDEISRINKNIANYRKKKRTVDWESQSCQLTQYVTENGIVVKIESDCGDHYWELYSVVLSTTTSKSLYGKYLETVPDARLPKVREFYSIGSMIPSDDAYGLIMDESGKEVAAAEYRKYNPLYDAAVLAFE